MLLSAVALNTYAKNYWNGDVVDIGDGFVYKVLDINAFTVAVTAINNTGDVVIPSTVFDNEDVTFTVTQLACGGSADITGLTLPNTVTTLTAACNGFPGLTVFHVPASVTKIERYDLFCSGSKKLERWEVEEGNPTYASEDGILYSQNMKTLLNIPRENNFVEDDGSYTIRDGVVSMNRSAHSYCKYLSKLNRLILPASFNMVPTNLRNDCVNLEAFVVKQVNANLSDDGEGVLLNGDGTEVLLYPQGKTGDYKVPDGVTSIANMAFRKSSFTELDLNGVTELASNAINDCDKLTSLSLGNVVTLAANSITGCDKLQTITIPATLTDLKDGAIVSCPNLTEFIVEEGNPNYASDNGVLYSADKKTLLLYPAGKTDPTYIIPDEFGVTKIAQSAFATSKISSITIPSTVESIDPYAFNASQIADIEFEMPSSLTTIGERAFSSTTKLKSFIWPEGVNEIPSDCFCSSYLESIVVPDNVKVINGNAFYASHLSHIKIGKGVTSIERSAFALSRLKTIEFDEKSNVTTIQGDAFWRTQLQTITLPTSLTGLSTNLFKECNQLTEIIVPDGSDLTTISAFGAMNLEKFTFEGSSKVTSIGSNAFKNHQKLTELHFPSTVITIGNEAFMNCQNLESVIFEGGEAEITTIGDAVFAECGLKSFDVPNKVKTIGTLAFRNCNVLEIVSVPASTTSIDPLAFSGCSIMTAINVDKGNETYSSTDGILLSKNKQNLVLFPMGKANSQFTLLPPSLVSIGNSSFYGNENLTNVTIPNKVTTIGKRAFGLCKNLNTVTLLCDEKIDPANVAQALNEAAFDDGVTTSDEQFSKINLNVRKDLLEEYQNDEYWNKFGTITPSFIDETSRKGGLNMTKAKEEFIAVSDNTVDLLSVETEDETYVLPTTVKQGDKTYNVGLVGDYLFTAHGSNVPNVKEVVVPGDVEYIGARAFLTDAALANTNSTVESVFLIGEQLNEDLLSTARFELTKEDLGASSTASYDEFGSTSKIYVRKSAEETYKTAWPHYTENISYKIPYTQSGEFGTFAREFDVDFSEVNGVNAEKPVTDDPVLIAFTGDGKYSKTGDTFSVHMTSINLGASDGTDGTYVPAGSGVLMKKYKDTEEGLYYQIAETGISEAFVDGNFMKGITIRPETVGTSEGYNRYYISGGKLHEMTKNTNFKNHKSYLEISTADIPAGAKVMLSFTDLGGETTGIESINADVDDSDSLYNLQGQRVTTAGKGIYIKNGKKIYVK